MGVEVDQGLKTINTKIASTATPDA
jgi:hypothetical protein